MKGDIDPAILTDVAAYYAAKLEANGATPQGVDWSSAESHETRHRQFLRLIGTAGTASVIDLGCGFGDFFRFLRAHNYAGRFIGYDIAPGMIEKARALYGEADDRCWRIGAAPDEVADYAIASGIFNVKGDVPTETWARYVQHMIGTLARAGRRGFAFNMLSLSSDPARRRRDLYYADPAQMLTFCLSTFGREVALLQDYGLYEFTAVVRRSQT